MATRTCRICGRSFPPEYSLTQGRCRMCDMYWRRHGVERPRNLRSLRPCQTCGRLVQAFNRGRCHTCYLYWYRTGRERPARLWQRP